MCRTAHADDPAGRNERMTQIIVPKNTPGVNIVRGVPVWGRGAAHSEIVYDNVRVPRENQTRPHRRRPPSGPGPAGRRARLPLHELHRRHVAGIRPDGAAHNDARGPRRRETGAQAIHAGLHRRQLHGHPVRPSDDHPLRGEDGKRRGPAHGHLRHQGVRAPGLPPSGGPRHSGVGAPPASPGTCPWPACTKARAPCASPTARTRCTASSSPRTCCAATMPGNPGTSATERGDNARRRPLRSGAASFTCRRRRDAKVPKGVFRTAMQAGGCGPFGPVPGEATTGAPVRPGLC